MSAERVEALTRLAAERGWRSNGLRTTVDVISVLLAHPLCDVTGLNWIDGSTDAAGGELDYDPARVAGVRRPRARAGQGLTAFLEDLRAAAERLDELGGRDVAAELETFLREHGPQPAATVAKAIRARAEVVRRVLERDGRFRVAERLPASARNARRYEVAEEAGRGLSGAGHADSGDADGSAEVAEPPATVPEIALQSGDVLTRFLADADGLWPTEYVPSEERDQQWELEFEWAYEERLAEAAAAFEAGAGSPAARAEWERRLHESPYLYGAPRPYPDDGDLMEEQLWAANRADRVD